MNPHHDSPVGRTSFASRMPVRNERPSRTIETSNTPIAQPALSIACGRVSFSTPSKTEKTPPRLNSTNATTNA